jgi:DNA invertase Pin-like site-specific DNA recombinase
MRNNSLGDSVPGLQGIVAQESDDPGHVFDVRNSMSFFPIHNASTGALGDFLRLIKSGKVAKGSALIIESPDRLSRQRFSDAWPTYQSILNAGVQIHFTSLNEILLPDHDFTDILRVGVSMDRAREETVRKSERIGGACRTATYTPISRLLNALRSGSLS